MSKPQSGQPGYLVTAARLGAWQRYTRECNGEDIAPNEFLPLQGQDIYTKASNGVAQALRDLTSSGQDRADALTDRQGNRYEFTIKSEAPLGDSLLKATTVHRDIDIDFPDEDGILAKRKVRVVAHIHGLDHMGPVMMMVHDSQNVEESMESMEWRATLALMPEATRLRQFHLGGNGKTIIDINRKITQRWRLYWLEIHDQYQYPELGKQVGAAIRSYLANPYNAMYSQAAARRAYVQATGKLPDMSRT